MQERGDDHEVDEDRAVANSKGRQSSFEDSALLFFFLVGLVEFAVPD